KFHEKHGFGIAAHDPLDRWPEHRYLARQAEHGAIDEFDRHRRKLDEMLRGVHRLKETAEMASAERAAAKHRRKLQLDAGRKRKRAFGADENMREVDIVIRREIEIVTAGKKRVEIVAADSPLDLREARFDLVGLARGDLQEITRQRQQ